MNPCRARNKKRAVRAVVTILCLTVASFVAFRIYYVNATAIQLPPVEKHSMNEWVDLNGAFLNSRSENTQGYSMRVTKAELLSYNEYIEKYGLDKGNKIEGLDEPSLICLEIEVKNDGNEDGVIFIFECKLIPERKNTYFIPSTDLWAESEKNMTDGNVRILKTAKDSEYTVHVPYKVNIKDPEGYTEYKKPMKDTSFELVVSNSPVRKIIEIKL